MIGKFSYQPTTFKTRKVALLESPVGRLLLNPEPIFQDVPPLMVVDSVVVDRRADRHKGSRTEYYREQKRKKRAEAKA